VAVAQAHAPADQDPAALADTVARRAVPAPNVKATLKLDGRLVIFPAGLDAAAVAARNGYGPTFPAAFPGERGPLQVPEQRAPGGAYLTLPPGEYGLAYRDHDGVVVLWLRRRQRAKSARR
jgi:hypothetical protein